MMKEQRLENMEAYILGHRSVSLQEICNEFSISLNTARKDIHQLAKNGKIVKVYGGAKAVTTVEKKPLLSFEQRNIVFMKEKNYICELAAKLIHNNDIIFIDTGTTTVNLINSLQNIACTIVTNSLQIAYAAIPYRNLKIVSLPGALSRGTLSFVGNETVESINLYNIDKAFMATTGLSLECGLTNASPDEYAIKYAIMKKCKTAYLLADHSKFGKASLRTFAQIEDLDAIITDKEPPKEYEEYCRKHSVKIIINDNQIF